MVPTETAEVVFTRRGYLVIGAEPARVLLWYVMPNEESFDGSRPARWDSENAALRIGVQRNAGTDRAGAARFLFRRGC
jgi:hypothetical protein